MPELAIIYSAVLGKEKAFQNPTRKMAKELMLIGSQ